MFDSLSVGTIPEENLVNTTTLTLGGTTTSQTGSSKRVSGWLGMFSLVKLQIVKLFSDL